MKKILLIISILILVACTIPTTPDDAPSSENSLISEAPVLNYIEDIEFARYQDSIKKERLSRKKEMAAKYKAIERENNVRQENVVKQIETLEQQHVMLDSLLKIKKDTLK
jgi:hypothetical protein